MFRQCQCQCQCPEILKGPLPSVLYKLLTQKWLRHVSSAWLANEAIAIHWLKWQKVHGPKRVVHHRRCRSHLPPPSSLHVVVMVHKSEGGWADLRVEACKSKPLPGRFICINSMRTCCAKSKKGYLCGRHGNTFASLLILPQKPNSIMMNLMHLIGLHVYSAGASASSTSMSGIHLQNANWTVPVPWPGPGAQGRVPK